jgi:molybdenum cofactor synthesis domain-containing protein
VAVEYRAAIITISDSCARGEAEDKSGPALSDAIRNLGIEPASSIIIPDDYNTIKNVLQQYAADSSIHLIMTTGGTGFGPRDVTPEATRSVIERSAPGISELLRRAGADQTPLTWLSRGESGIAGGKLIINLPGSPKAMAHSIETLRPILIHALDLLNGKKPH